MYDTRDLFLITPNGRFGCTVQLPRVPAVEAQHGSNEGLDVLSALKALPTEVLARPVIYFIHGAGMDRHAFDELFSLDLSGADSSMRIPNLCCTIDLRGHGGTETAEDGLLSIAQLTEDVAHCIVAFQVVLRGVQGVAGGAVGPVYLVGHSLGGAVAVHLCHHASDASRGYGAECAGGAVGPAESAGAAWAECVRGVVCIDTAGAQGCAAVERLPQLLRSRPENIASAAVAVDWMATRGGMANRARAARYVPTLLRKASPPQGPPRLPLAHAVAPPRGPLFRLVQLVQPAVPRV